MMEETRIRTKNADRQAAVASDGPSLQPPAMFEANHISWFSALQFRVRKAIATRRYSSYYGGRLFRIGPHKIVKSNPYLRITEARTLDFIAKNTSIPVPRVLEVFTQDGTLSMVMEYIDAPSLDTIWHKMSSQERDIIVTQLRDHLLQLRALTPPYPGRVQAIDQSGLFDTRQQNTPFGPFQSIKDFNDFIGIGYIQKDLNEENLSYFERFNARSYRTTFTHGDLAPRNILVKNGSIVAIIDWECAGWYPEYWEYTSCFRSNLDCREFWRLVADKNVAGSYSDELVIDQLLSSVFIRC